MATRTRKSDREWILKGIVAEFGNEVTRTEISKFADSNGINFPQWLTDSKIGPSLGISKPRHGVYRLPSLDGDDAAPVAVAAPVAPAPAAPAAPVAAPVLEDVPAPATMIKEHDYDSSDFYWDCSPDYVRWGHHKDLKTILKSGMCVPVYIYGLSGNGKTFMVEQVCAEMKRMMFKVSITPQTEEGDLLGDFRLVDGETVWFDGPVVLAMKHGAVLLLDEIDFGGRNLLCLQSVLEGNGVLIKKTNTYVKPAPGFTIVATANTKGDGDESGRFTFTNVMNEAMLDRFPVTLEQPYPKASTEMLMLERLSDSFGLGASNKEYMTKVCTRLVKWANQTRELFKDGGSEDLIATRRLVHIMNAIAIFSGMGSKLSESVELKAVKHCISRFGETSRESFYELYRKMIDIPVEGSTNADPDGEAVAVNSDNGDNSFPF
jgi:MoxR-like ATPase